MTYVLGARSLQNLQGVHPQLQAVVKLAIGRSSVDFGVHEGLRTPERQAEYVRMGVSRTLNSKHLMQPDGYGHAVDLVPYIDGQLRWEWMPIYGMAADVLSVAGDLGVRIVWGGVWDRISVDLPRTAEQLRREVSAYCDRHPGPDFIDGPHWQLVGE